MKNEVTGKARPFFAFLLGLVLVSATSCEKPEVLSPDIYGTWTIEKVRILGDELDSSFSLSGQFVFRKSTLSYNAGGTVYGEELAATADIPVCKGTKESYSFSTVNRDIFFTQPTDPSNYNFKGFYNGLHGYIDPIDKLNHYATARISFLSKDRMIFNTGVGNSSTNSQFSEFTIELKKK